jgi:hypothetical protein
MTKSRLNQVDAESVVSEIDKVWAGQKDRLLEWHEEVSRITTLPCVDAYDFVLHAYGPGDEQILTISINGVPEARLDIGVGRDDIEKLTKWFLRSMHKLDKLRKKKGLKIEDAIKQAKGAQVDMEKLIDWERDVSRIKICSWRDKCKFKLHAYGAGEPPQVLIASVGSKSARKMETISIGRDGIEQLAKWLVDCLFLLDWLRQRKEAEITDALRRRKQILRSQNYHTM